MAHPNEPPIATATVAHLYLEQGLLDQAEALFRRLLAESPHDPRVLGGLAEVRRRRAAPARELEGDWLELAAGPEGRLLCRWRISEESRGGASLVLGRPGELALRLMAFPHDPQQPPLTLPLAHGEGALDVDGPRGGAMIGAAVGLVDEDGHFVSICHCPLVALPEERSGDKHT